MTGRRGETLDARQHRMLLWLMCGAASWRWLLSARTPVPSEDGVNYLWMAEQFADLQVSAALSEPFSPLWPLLLSVPMAFGVDPLVAAKVLGSVVGALALWPIAAIAERLRPGAGLPAAALAATSSLLSRTAAEVYTEPLFVLVAAVALYCGLTNRVRLLGLAAATAFWVRPEGVLLVVPFLLLGWRKNWPAVLWVVGGVALLGLVRMLCGHGFDPVPKLAFHEARADLGDERGALFGNLLAVPAAYMEAFLAAGLLAFLALLPPRPRGSGALWWTLLCGVAVIVSFVVRRRFFLGWSAAVLPLAGVGVAGLGRIGPRGRELILGVACSFDLWTAWHGTIDENRIAERYIGRQLAADLVPGEVVTGDLTRVLYFAGMRPLPARHFDAGQLIEMASAPDVRYVVLSSRSKRGVHDEVVAGLPQFTRYAMPRQLEDLAEERGVTVLVRR